MDRPRVGRGVRALRHRRGWRQQDLGERVGVSQDLISLIERGHVGRMQLDTLDRVAHALDAELVVYVRWRGGELDRLLDAAHAAIQAEVVRGLRDHGWQVLPEVTYQVFGERGSIDLLAWHQASETLLVVEVKSELTSLEETLRRHDEKVRLAARIARERSDWRARRAVRLLALPDTTASRRRVREHDLVLTSVYPMRGFALRRWLRAPRGDASTRGGLLYVRYTTGESARRGSPSVRRVRRKATRTPRQAASAAGGASGAEHDRGSCSA